MLIRRKGRCGVFAGNSVWSTSERLVVELLTIGAIQVPLPFLSFFSKDWRPNQWAMLPTEGTCPDNARWTKVATLSTKHCHNASQCRTGEMCSHLQLPVTRQVAELWVDYRRLQSISAPYWSKLLTKQLLRHGWPLFSERKFWDFPGPL